MKHGVRVFMYATTQGRIFDERGSFASLPRGGNYAGARINAAKRDEILRDLGLSKKHWHRLIGLWTGVGMAHRCSRAVVSLLVEPCDACIACGAAIELSTTAEN